MGKCSGQQFVLSIAMAVAALTGGLAGGPQSGRAAEPRAGALTGEQLREQAAILAEFRRAKASPEQRLAIIDKAAEHSRFTLRNLLEALLKEMNRPLSDYRQQFTKAAGEATGQRANPLNLQQVAELRANVLTLAKQEGLTKEMIVATSDPALQRLKEIILVSRDEVLKAHPELVKKRATLERLGTQWEKCAVLMLKDESEESSEEESDPVEPPSFEGYLKKEEEIAAALAVPMDAATRTVLAANLQLASKVDPEEFRCVLDLNLTRNLLGLPPLQIDLMLAAVARDHSADMDRLNFFSHESPLPGKTTPFDRAKRAGTTASGENIAVGTLDGAVANTMWWHSPGHHKNMLGNHKRVGLGRTGKYWTELFGR